MKETKTLEFQETTETNSFLKTVSAFANYSDGKIIFGVCDDGTIKGIDHPEEACLNLENKINDSIKPIPFYTLEINNDKTITMEVKKGIYTPYFYKGKAYKRNDAYGGVSELLRRKLLEPHRRYTGIGSTDFWNHSINHGLVSVPTKPFFSY